MKQLWTVLVNKLSEVEPLIAAIYIGILSLASLWAATTIILRFFKVVTEIVLALK